MAKHWLLAFTLVAACSSDDGAPTPTYTVTGVVEIGNYIGGATVFVDLGDSDILGSAPRTTTDATGHFSLTYPEDGPAYPHSIVAIVHTDSTVMGGTGAGATVGFTLHLRAPLASPPPEVDTVVITPLSTLVVSEVGNGMPQADAEAKVASELSASLLPFTGTPDVLVDYAADYATSADSKSLRFVAGAVAAVVAGAVTEINAKQTQIDCNNAKYFNPLIATLDDQLTPLADGAFKFTQLTTDQQNDVLGNPANYHDYFINTQMMADDIEAQLEAAAEDLALELFREFKDEFIQDLEEGIIRLVAGEIFAELVLG